MQVTWPEKTRRINAAEARTVESGAAKVGDPFRRVLTGEVMPGRFVTAARCWIAAPSLNLTPSAGALPRPLRFW